MLLWGSSPEVMDITCETHLRQLLSPKRWPQAANCSCDTEGIFGTRINNSFCFIYFSVCGKWPLKLSQTKCCGSSLAELIHGQFTMQYLDHWHRAKTDGNSWTIFKVILGHKYHHNCYVVQIYQFTAKIRCKRWLFFFIYCCLCFQLASQMANGEGSRWSAAS